MNFSGTRHLGGQFVFQRIGAGSSWVARAGQSKRAKAQVAAIATGIFAGSSCLALSKPTHDDKRLS
jgi:hypothetical protein